MKTNALPSFIGGTSPGPPGLSAALGQLGAGFDAWTLRPMRIATSFAREQVWQGATAFQVLPGVAADLEMISTVGGDIAGGVGARVLEAVYLNSRFELRLARGDMDGLVLAPFFEVDVPTDRTTVTPVTDAIRLLAVRVVGVGANGANAGIVTVSIGGVEQSVITRAAVALTMLANRGQPAFTVPTGYVATLQSWSGDGGPAQALEAKESRPGDSPFVAVQALPPRIVIVPGPEHEQVDPMTFRAGTDLRLVYESVVAEAVTTFNAPRAQFYLSPDPDTSDENPSQRPKLAKFGWMGA